MSDTPETGLEVPLTESGPPKKHVVTQFKRTFVSRSMSPLSDASDSGHALSPQSSEASPTASPQRVDGSKNFESPQMLRKNPMIPNKDQPPLMILEEKLSQLQANSANLNISAKDFEKEWYVFKEELYDDFYKKQIGNDDFFRLNEQMHETSRPNKPLVSSVLDKVLLDERIRGLQAIYRQLPFSEFNDQWFVLARSLNAALETHHISGDDYEAFSRSLASMEQWWEKELNPPLSAELVNFLTSESKDTSETLAQRVKEIHRRGETKEGLCEDFARDRTLLKIDLDKAFSAGRIADVEYDELASIYFSIHWG